MSIFTKHPVVPARGFDWLYTRVADVVEPVAQQYRGRPVDLVRPALRQAWQEAFDAELPGPALTRCATAVHDGTPWEWALWNDDWRRPAGQDRGAAQD